MTGDLVYFWIPVPDDEAAKRFYGDLLGWEFDQGNQPGGSQITNTTPHGGISGGADSASHPQVVFEVDDLDAGIAKVRELGGDAGEPQSTSAGRWVECRDDQGTSFNLRAPK
jgi:predicted enzyme related to lactoylglutathione lyase